MADFRRMSVALAIVASSVLLAGCGVSESSATLPDLRAAGDGGGLRARDLLYVAAGKNVYVYTYPQHKLLGTLGPMPGDLCSDSQGDVFISQPYDQVLEYAHGAVVPKLTLTLPTFAVACATDPLTGDLAVTNEGHGVTVVPYGKRYGWGFAKTYNESNIETSAYCGYDAGGNLFVDGISTKFAFVLYELPKGGKALEPITLDQSIAKAGPVQWDGKHLTVADLGPGSTSIVTIYRFNVSGSSGTRVGSTKLSDSNGKADFWIQGNSVIAPYAKHKYVQGIGFCAIPGGW